MNRQYEHVDADDVAQEERNMEICGSKRRKISDSWVNCSESNAESDLLPTPNGSRNTSLACLDEAHATVCSADITNTEVVAQHDASLNDGKESSLEGSQIECTGLGQESLDGKSKTEMERSELTTNEDSSGKLSVSDRAGGNYEQVEQPKLSAKGNVVCGVYIADEKLKEPKKKIEDEKASDEASTMNHPITRLGMNTEAKMDAINALSGLVAIKINASQTVKENLPPKILSSCTENGLSHSRKKLLVLDVNGLIVDIVPDPQEGYVADTIIGSKAVFKRPYCDEFLQFCFEKFNVGVWTSRTRRNIERVLDFLIRDTQHQLLFCWDQSHCTETGFSTIENKDKPLVLKELKRLWEKKDPNLPWDRGVYDESNTLLLDDSPYKALRNPPCTAIFPHTYCYRNREDNSLGPEGDLRNYLERLAESDNVQKFIAQNPFGQQPITKNNESWRFYLKVIAAAPSEPEVDTTRKKLIILDVGGLLVDIISDPRERYRADAIIRSRAVFKRPYCDEFLQFCFERFNVGVWTSTTRRNVEPILDFLLRDTQHELLFCWDKYHCTDTGFSTVENWDKPLVLKELKMLWEKQDPNLPWDRGEYNESNTVLMELHPYRALRNPPYTAIFPYPYHHYNREDNSLGPQGDLRNYLERVAQAENVQKFIEKNPFGQRPITERNLSWKFYLRVIGANSSEPQAVPTSSSAAAQFANSSETEANPTSSSAAAQCANTSGPEADPTGPSAAAPCANSFKPEADPAGPSTAAQRANSSELETDPTGSLTAAQCANSSEPETDPTGSLAAAQRANSSDPETDPTSSLAPAQRANTTEPEADYTSPSAAAQCGNSSEPEANPTSPSAAAQCANSSEDPTSPSAAAQCSNSSEPKADPTCSLAAAQHSNSSKLEADPTCSSATAQCPNSSEPVADTTSSLAALRANSSEPETDATSSSAALSIH